MIPITQENRDLLDKQEARFVEHHIWLAKDGLTRSVEAITNVRHLKQFVIGLSTAILGVVFPSLINKLAITSADDFLLAFVLFCVITIWGLVSLIVPTLREVRGVHMVSNHHIEQTKMIIQKIRQIKKMEDNAMAGREFEMLQAEYKKLNLGERSFLMKLFSRYEDTFFYALFIVAFSILIKGIFENLSL